MKSEGLVSEECFVFADDSAGNPICMKIGGEDKESIFFCNHELENTSCAVRKRLALYKELINDMLEQSNIFLGKDDPYEDYQMPQFVNPLL